MTKPTETKSELIALSKLLGMRHPKNPKKHDIPKLVDSYNRYGFVGYLLVDKSRGLAAGHGRIEALAKLLADGAEPPRRIVKKKGEWLVPVHYQDFASNDDFNAYVITDNQITIAGGWDDELLAELAQSLEDTSALGFDESDLEALLAVELVIDGGTAGEGGPGREVDVAAGSPHTRLIGGGGGDADDGDDVDRDTWCTPKLFADAIGSVQLDPCSNERSHILAERTFRLDREEDGLVLAQTITAQTLVFINPPYSDVMPWIEAYGHTRFIFLLKIDPSTKWFTALVELSAVILIPKGTRIQFEAPPGVPKEKSQANPFPHGFFFAQESDVPPALAALCFPAWNVADWIAEPKRSADDGTARGMRTSTIGDQVYVDPTIDD